MSGQRSELMGLSLGFDFRQVMAGEKLHCERGAAAMAV